MKSIEELFHTMLQDVYFAERRLVKSLAVLAQASTDPALREAFARVRFETQQQIVRLQQVFEIVGRRARGRQCDAIVGIISEAEEVVKRTASGSVRDAGILATAQAAAHYEIARYVTLIAWAEQLNDPQVTRLLRRSLEEEQNADALLNQVAASSVNRAAQAA